MANTVDTTATLEYAAEDLVDDSHKHYDVGYKAAFAEIATLFENIRDDVRILKTRLDDPNLGVFVRSADLVGCDPAALASRAQLLDTLRTSGDYDSVVAEMRSPTDLSNLNSGSLGNLQSQSPNAGTVGSTNGAGPFAPRSNVPAGVGENNAIVDREGRITTTDAISADLIDDLIGSDNSTRPIYYTDRIREKTRNKDIQESLFRILQDAGAECGVAVEIFSAGQDAPGPNASRTGSRRHDNGYAADVRLYVNGELLYHNNTNGLRIIKTFVAKCYEKGATGIGVGPGYMANCGIHVDIALGQPGVGSGRAWAGRSKPYTYDKAPQWLKDLAGSRTN